jgi:hypothetical protein
MQHYSHLQAYLETVLPPIQVTVIIESFELLHRCGIDGQDYQIQQELALAEDGDNNTTIQSIYNLVTPLMVQTLAQFGVTCTGEASLDDMRDILNGLVDLENYGDPITIIQFCDNADGPEEGLSQILPFVGKGTVGHYLHVIESVNPKQLERIEAVCQGNLQEAPGNSELLDEIRNRLNKFTRAVGAETFMVVHDIRGGQRLGLPVVNYLEPHEEELRQYATDKKNLTGLVHQILAFVLASNTPITLVGEVTMNEIDELIEDKAWLSTADVALVSLLKDLDHA